MNNPKPETNEMVKGSAPKNFSKAPMIEFDPSWVISENIETKAMITMNANAVRLRFLDFVGTFSIRPIVIVEERPIA